MKIVISDTATGEEFYSIEPNGEKILLWKCKWFDLVALMNDGRHHMRFGTHKVDEINYSDLAIAFYDKNVLLKAYEVRDLVRNTRTIPPSGCFGGYDWKLEDSSISTGFSQDSSTYTLITRDKIVYTFDVYNGNIINSYADSTIKTSEEISALERQASHEEGLRLLKNTKSFKQFEKYFIIQPDEISVGQFIVDTAIKWQGNLYPIKKSHYRWLCELKLPIKNDSLQISINPKTIYNVFEDFIASKFIKRFLNYYPNITMRIRIDNNILHWESLQKREYNTILSRNGFNFGNPAQWAEIILDYYVDNNKYMIVFLHPLYSNFYVVDNINKIPKVWEKYNLTTDEDIYSTYSLKKLLLFDRNENITIISN